MAAHLYFFSLFSPFSMENLLDIFGKIGSDLNLENPSFFGLVETTGVSRRDLSLYGGFVSLLFWVFF